MSNTVASELVLAIESHANRLALSDAHRQLSYAQLGQFVMALDAPMRAHEVVGIFGAPGLAMGASAIACVIHGRPFVHLDPAMPQMVLHNILSELRVGLVILCEPAEPGKLSGECATLEAEAFLAEALNSTDTAPQELRAPPVAPTDPIYLVATSGTTGRPKCIPVTQDAAFLSYQWRDAYTPYTPDTRVGIYVFAIWEMFRPLRNGASLWFPDAGTLFAPTRLAHFLSENHIDEMLFTPSFYDTFLNALDTERAAALHLSRVILNGEVVSDDLISASKAKLPKTTLLNLYSICETHDICISELTQPAGGAPAPVGIPMSHLRAVILDEAEQPCPPGTSGQLFFEGSRMLGPGYVNRPEETRLRFREMVINGRKMRLYDTGDQARETADGTLYIEGRIAHMLKLRGFSIQTNELIETMRDRIGFFQAAPWVSEVKGRGQCLIFYFAADCDQATRNAKTWGLEPGINRTPAALAAELRELVPHYCVPAFLVQMEALPLHPVSGKADVNALPNIEDSTTTEPQNSNDLVLSAAARAMSCSATDLDPALSFHDLGGDSLMCVNLILELERIYNLPVDFDLAMNVPLHRLDQLLTQEADAPAVAEPFEQPGILLTGATGFLGGHVLAHAARTLPEGEVVYCLVRNKNRGARDRLDAVAKAHGIAPERYVIVNGTLDAPQFSLGQEQYGALARVVTRVIHCAAMVNLAIGRQEMLDWSARGITTVLEFCGDASADLRFTSSTSVFPDRGGPWPEGLTPVWEGCTGYGAAKIAAETTIRNSGIPAAIVRLPSLYDLDAPNPRDLYEAILKASVRAACVPQGLAFPMIDVTAAAAYLLGDITTPVAAIYNLIPEQRVSPAQMPSVAVNDWLEKVTLEPGIARIIAEFPETLRADATFETAATRDAWLRVSDARFETLCDADMLLARRSQADQGNTASAAPLDMDNHRAASLAK
ncbi:AMP-binding protein [Epibacterium sp. SM1969]|uniref:AMP-binding protein n=1 Tax=Tritonibacter aquimaris TaxID=2663379 RepID=A0A844AVU9_9RHOB|nr:AMP-binding protein [Tritonibacter aquimaris]MQY43608.1 AMP-binding protein [Tritonibacter aquimaris]